MDFFFYLFFERLSRTGVHIAKLTESLNQLAASQAQELKALPSLFADLKISMKETTTAYQNWMEAQKMRQDSQKRLTDELIKVANRQLELTKVLTSYQQDIPSLESLKADTIKIESDLAKSQTQTNSSKSLMMTTQSAIEKQVTDLSQLLQQLES